MQLDRAKVFLDELIGETCNAAERLTSEACELMATVYGFLNANYEIKLRFIKLALGAFSVASKD
eukprot:238751-Amphidinium_carterae.1